MTPIRSTTVAFLFTIGLALAACGGGAQNEGSAEGVVRDVNSAQAKVTIAHGDIPGMMKAMTMTFAVADAAMLDGVQPGDTVDFKVRYADGKYTVTALSPKK